MIALLKRLIKGAGKYGNLPATIDLPIERMAEIALRYYGNDRAKKAIPVGIVVIYNIDELASKIAEHLKNSTDDSSKRDGENEQ